VADLARNLARLFNGCAMLVLGCSTLAAQESVLPVEVRWAPERPVRGTLFVIRVAGEPPPVLAGQFSGEPLHFRAGEDGSAWTVAAVPVDAAGSLELELEAIWPDGHTERAERSVPVVPGSYVMEQLTVAPEFGAPLPPALALRTEEESERAQGVARGAHDSSPLWKPGNFVQPRAGRITSGFGNGREFNGQVQSRHLGTDLDGAVGEPVLAAADGVVALVDEFYLGGNVIYLDHGGGLSTGYLHLSEALVATGDTVRAGQLIGSVGATGRVTGPHLHWIVRYGSVTVDPMSVFGLEP